jgi:hypothetical protein
MRLKPTPENLRPAIAFFAAVAVMALGELVERGFSLFWGVALCLAVAGACVCLWLLSEERRRPSFQYGMWQGEDKSGAAGTRVRLAGIFVREAKGQPVNDATVTLDSLWNSEGWHSPHARQVLLTESQWQAGRGDGHINFAPHEDRRVLLCGLDEAKPDSDIFFAYTNRKLASAVPRGEYFARVRIAGGARPASAVLRLWVDEGGKLNLALHHMR